MPTEVQGYRADDQQRFETWIDGIVAVAIPYTAADKFKGMAPALHKAVWAWAKERDDSDAKLDGLSRG